MITVGLGLHLDYFLSLNNLILISLLSGFDISFRSEILLKIDKTTL